MGIGCGLVVGLRFVFGLNFGLIVAVVCDKFVTMLMYFCLFCVL